MPGRRPAAALVAALLLVAGCSSFADAQPDEAGEDAHVTTGAPDGDLTVVADAGAAASAVSTSRALFRSSDVAVVAGDGDPAGTLLGASAAVGLGVPLLLEGGDDDALAAEIDRLGVSSVLVVGDVDASALVPGTVAVPADPDAVAQATGLRFSDADPVEAGAEVAAVAGLDPEEPAALAPADAQPGAAAGDDGEELPAVARLDPLDGVVVLAEGSPESLAGVATARAAGARVELLDGTDPRASADAVDVLSAGSTTSVLALGAGFAADDGLDWKVATARAGTQLPGGGQVLFPGRMLVALYGSPGSGALGVLGEQDVDASVQRARDHAAPFEDLVDVPVVPAFEIIATVASSVAGPDGNYSTELDPETLRPWVEAARDAGLYVVLDLQPGRTDFLTQAKQYRSLLELPNVGLALDPEWRLGPGEQHLTQIGSVGVDEVNATAAWLADLTRDERLPQKLFVVHQFQLRMIDGRDRLDTSRDELAVLVHADGQGGQGDKQGTWSALHQDLPPGPLYWGWKNFYDEDAPMLTPAQTIEQVQPRADLVTYQ